MWWVLCDVCFVACRACSVLLDVIDPGIGLFRFLAIRWLNLEVDDVDYPESIWKS